MFTKRHTAFTLIEIMIVLVIIGTMAGVLLPRMSFYFEPPSAILQRAFEEAANLALSGTSLRMSVRHERTTERGPVEAEALVRHKAGAGSLSEFLGTDQYLPDILEWEKVSLKNIPEGDYWKFEPEIIYFYSDGSCTPARISYKPPNVPERDAEEYVLTVTGYTAKLEK